LGQFLWNKAHASDARGLVAQCLGREMLVQRLTMRLVAIAARSVILRCLGIVSGGLFFFLIAVASATAQQGDLSAILRRFNELHDAGNYPAALVEAHKLEAGIKARFGINHINYAVALDSLARVYGQQGKYLDAKGFEKRALAIAEKTVGANHPDTATILNNLADMYWRQGKYAEAEAYYKRVLTIPETKLGKNHPQLAHSFHGLANVYKHQGKYPEAEAHYKRALAIQEKLGKDTFAASALGALALLYQAQGKYPEAEAHYKRALAIREEKLGADHLDVARSLNNLGGLYLIRGKYSDAEAHHKRALAIREEKLGANHPDVAETLVNLAIVYKEQGKYADADGLYKRALAIQERALGANHPDVAETLESLAIVYNTQGKYADAEGLFKRALAIQEKALGAEHPGLAVTFGNLSEVYREQGKYTDAEGLSRRSLAVFEKVLGAEHPYVAASLNSLAEVYRKQGRYADADGLYKRALAIQEKALGANHPDVADTFNNLAILYASSGNSEEALAYSRKATACIIAYAAIDAAGAQHKEGVGGFVEQHPNYFVRHVANLAAAAQKRLEPEAQLGREALAMAQWATRSSAAAAVQQLSLRFAAGTDALAALVRDRQDLSSLWRDRNKAFAETVSKPEGERNPTLIDAIRKQIAETESRLATNAVQLEREFPGYAALASPEPLKAEEAAQLLSADEALIFWLVGEKESYVFALTHDESEWKTIALGGEALAQKVAAFRRGLDVNVLFLGDWSGLFDLSLSHELYNALIGPIEPLIRDKRHLMVVPTGALTALPFHLLAAEKPAFAVPQVKTARDLAAYRDAAWLLKRHAVSVLPSVASLKALRVFGRRDRAKNPLVGFGDPIFNSEEESRPNAQEKMVVASRSYPEFWKGMDIDRSLLRMLPRLPETADELRAVAKNLGAPESNIHLRADASESTVKESALADYRVVYFATHGLVAGEVKGLAEPSLALTLPKQPSEIDDGLLTASEVAQLKLNADWVVLSACNTIAGDKPGAEALSGLARAFFYAGTRALLVSHWAVESNAATALTTSTFDILKSNPTLGRAEALQRAMLAYMNNTSDPRNAYPALWAPFVVVGEGAGR
jgi:CHAT domain-containing protein/tetratricopeptide (TPR) repeat protein